jgi:hypothetical protein
MQEDAGARMKGRVMSRSTTLESGGDRLVWLGLAVAVFFFLATGAIAYFNFQTLKQDSALLVRADEALTALEDILSTVKDAETGQRGYLLTGKDSYLDPYNTAVQEIGAAGSPRRPETAHRRQTRRAQTDDRPPPEPGTGCSARSGANRSW